MNSLFWKGMLAFLVVILVAVGTVALLTGRVTENAFRRYALTRSGMWEGLTTQLADYYHERSSWEGVQDVLAPMRERWPHGRGRDVGPPGPAPRMIDFRIADAERGVVGDTRGLPSGAVSQGDLDDGVPIEVDGEVVGYLLPALRHPPDWPLDAAQAAFLFRVRMILWIGAAAALGAALIVGGLLFRSITAPLRRLTTASEAIAGGDLSARADVRGRDEVAQLADSFNEMAESLSQMEMARRNQTADIAHELRTPLTVLQGTIEAMLDGVYSTDSENLQAALSQTRTLSRLIEDLRILALADAGKLYLERDCLDLEPFLREIVEAHQPPAREQGIALVLDVPSTLPPVCVDRDRLAQVIGNLLANSLLYVQQGGHVTVEASRKESGVVVSVTDDGPGVAPGDLPHLFERFWRADPARQRATGGSGLGLSIARYIVEAHGGRIWAEPTPGGGLTVRFSLPTPNAASPQAPRRP
jgi:signal transduction histidine kinase